MPIEKTTFIKENKETQIQFKVTKSQKEIIKELASSKQMTITEFIYHCIEEYIYWNEKEKN